MQNRCRFLLPLVWILAGCALPASQAEITSTPGIEIIVPYPEQTAPGKEATTTPTALPVVPTSAPFPAWATSFAEPILRGVQSRPPDFQDKFPEICINEEDEWKVCATPEIRSYFQEDLSDLAFATPRPTLDLQPDLQNGYALVNSGWFYLVPESKKNPYLARIESGGLILSLPNGNERRDFWVYHRNWRYADFLLQFDVEFLEAQPQDRFRFLFQDDLAFDLIKNKTWEWSAGSAEPLRGSYDYIELPRARVLLIVQDAACAVYLNNLPAGYMENCRPASPNFARPMDAAFHLLSEPGHPSAVLLDNFALWDLSQNSP